MQRRKRAGKAWSREIEWQPWTSPVRALRPLVFCGGKTRATRLARPAALAFVFVGADCAPAPDWINRRPVAQSKRFLPAFMLRRTWIAIGGEYLLPDVLDRPLAGAIQLRRVAAALHHSR